MLPAQQFARRMPSLCVFQWAERGSSRLPKLSESAELRAKGPRLPNWGRVVSYEIDFTA
jgi:hypothetical protein